MNEQVAVCVIPSAAGFFAVTHYLVPYEGGLKWIVESSDEVRPVIKIPFCAILILAQKLQTAGFLEETISWKPHPWGRAWLKLAPEKGEVVACRVAAWTVIVGTLVTFKIEASKLHQLGRSLQAYAEEHL